MGDSSPDVEAGVFLVPPRTRLLVSFSVGLNEPFGRLAGVCSPSGTLKYEIEDRGRVGARSAIVIELGRRQFGETLGCSLEYSICRNRFPIAAHFRRVVPDANLAPGASEVVGAYPASIGLSSSHEACVLHPGISLDSRKKMGGWVIEARGGGEQPSRCVFPIKKNGACCGSTLSEQHATPPALHERPRSD